ncbi:MAG TPA: M23 family metallopeptidase [Cyclobacteriaceae bacterium]|nr:M23 family metallopeptidase [Cyclobacteriaceae bacterium]
MRFFHLIAAACFVLHAVQAQENPAANNKYVFPIKPGQQNFLTGTMGELRTTHFHAGIDIRTEGRIGLPVFATQDGYISRATMSTAGYGNTIYIQHPDGNTSVYAHLDKFHGELAKYVLQEQYRRKSFEINLYFRPGQFVVKRADTIAFFGNSGSSGGPHLHFDIRDSRNDLLNPLSFGFAEIEDRVAPIAEKIALRPLDAYSRVNDKFSRQEFYVQRLSEGNYIIQNPILAQGNIGIELLAHDKLSYSHYRCGINYIEMHIDDELYFAQAIDKISFTEQRYVLAHMNYPVLKSQGNRFHKLYIDDGNALRYYKTNTSKAKLKINEDEEKKVEILMRDAYGNKSILKFKLKGSKLSDEVIGISNITEASYKITDNTLTVFSPGCGEEQEAGLLLYHKGKSYPLDYTYQGKGGQVYLFDLRNYLPDSIQVCGKTLVTNLKALVPSTSDYKYFGDFIDLHFTRNALFDTLYLSTQYMLDEDKQQEFFGFGDQNHALFKTIHIVLKPQLAYSKDKKTAVYKSEGKWFSYVGGDWQNDRISFNTRDFGTYTLLRDEKPPTIERISLNSAGARFKIRDDLSGIAKFEATINGQWLLMHYDNKISTIWSEKLDKSVPLKGEFLLRVTDVAGNSTEFKQTIN